MIEPEKNNADQQETIVEVGLQGTIQFGESEY